MTPDTLAGLTGDLATAPTDGLLVFGGTAEGRALCEALSRYGVAAHVCTATAYGEALVDALPRIHVHSARMDAEAMAAFITQGAFRTVIDATHPYATDVTRNIREACARAGCARIRVVRDGFAATGSTLPGIRAVPHMEAAVDALATTTGTIFLATGTKDLARFCRLPDYRDRLYVRVLPDAASIGACTGLGLPGAHIVAMQGPFSHELNVALLRQFGCAFMVTKNTGTTGGLDAKISAAREAGAELILVDRPEQETGHTVGEVLALLGLAAGAAQTGGGTYAAG